MARGSILFLWRTPDHQKSTVKSTTFLIYQRYLEPDANPAIMASAWRFTTVFFYFLYFYSQLTWTLIISHNANFSSWWLSTTTVCPEECLWSLLRILKCYQCSLRTTTNFLLNIFLLYIFPSKILHHQNSWMTDQFQNFVLWKSTGTSQYEQQ